MKYKTNSDVKLKLSAVIAAAAVFVAVTAAVVTSKAWMFDDPVRFFIYDLRSDWFTPAVKVITYMGNWQSITLLCIILLCFRQSRITYGLPVSAGAVSVTILNKIIKSVVERPRPDDIIHLVNAGGFSFPSGHSITSMFVFGMLIYLVRTNMQNRRAANAMTVVLAVPMICIGLSRIYLGVHYPTDVLAGWCLGIIMIVIIYMMFRGTSFSPAIKNRQ